MGHQGYLCGHESGCVGAGSVESQRNGAASNDEIRLACVGDRKAALGARRLCIQVAEEVVQSDCSHCDVLIILLLL